MRLIYLHQYFVTPEMAGGTRSYEWATRLATHGYDVQVVTSDPGPDARRRVTIEAGVTVHWLPVRYDNVMSLPRRSVAFLEYAAKASWIARRLRGDLVFATSTPLTVVIPAMAAILRRPVPMVFEVRDLWPEIPIAMGGLRNPMLRCAARMLERTAYRHATRVVALSPEMRAGVERAGFPAESIVLVPNASDVSLFRRAGVEVEAENFRRENEWLADRPLVLYAGAFGRANDVSALVEIAAATRRLDPDIRFLLIGEGAEREKIASLAASRGVLDETVFMLPSQPKKIMPGLMAAASLATSVFADIPELTATSPNKVFDAFAAGLPVATTVGGSIGEMLRETGAGLVLSRCPEVAAEQLADFLADPEKVARSRAASARLADEAFGRDALFLELESALADAYREGRVIRRLRPGAPGKESEPGWWRGARNDGPGRRTSP